MATKIYNTGTVTLIDGTELFITPLKIKYLREFMDMFSNMEKSKTDDESVDILVECVKICMKQFCPVIKTKDDVEDSIDMKTLYTILDISAGITFNETKSEEQPVKEKIENKSSWETWDLAKLESEAFLLGIWKDYEDLESSLSISELTAILEAKRETEYREQKFLAALQGVDLDEQTGKKQEDPWEAMKARVFSGGTTSDPNDILSLQGVNAAKAGFGIGMGIDYEKWD